MKQIASLFLSMILFINIAYSQERKFSVNTNILNLFTGGPSLAINYDLQNKWSIQAYASTGKFINGYSFKTGIVDFKYHFSRSMYIGPYFRYIEKTINREGTFGNSVFVVDYGRHFKGNGISSGASLGVHIVNGKRLNIESFIGAGYGKFIRQSGDIYGSGFWDARIGVLTGIKF